MAETIETIQQVINRIQDLAESDYEAAHGLEDSLLLSVLEAIANGTENPQELAAEAIKVVEIEYPRYCLKP